MVGTMCNDGPYILEWVAHYRLLGFRKIVIYTNDNIDGSDELLDALADNGVIVLVRTARQANVPPEAKAFNLALNLSSVLRDHEWALFVDSDEILVLAPEYSQNIDAFIDRVESLGLPQPVAAVAFQWLWFVSDFQFRRTPGLLQQRFQHARQHWLSKSQIGRAHV